MSDDIRRRWLRIGGVLIVVVGLLLIALLFAKDHQSSSGHDDRYYDKASGETVSTINGKSPDTYGSASNTLYLGFGTLLEHGFTQDQTTAIQKGYQQYASQQKLKLNQVSVVVASYQNGGADSEGNGIVTFDAQFNRQNTYKTTIVSTSATDFTMKLADSTGSQVFSYTYAPDRATDPTNN